MYTVPDWGSTANRRRVVTGEGLKVVTTEDTVELCSSRVVRIAAVMYRRILEHLLLSRLLLLLLTRIKSIYPTYHVHL